jgi:hypothetical protein
MKPETTFHMRAVVQGSGVLTQDVDRTFRTGAIGATPKYTVSRPVAAASPSPGVEVINTLTFGTPATTISCFVIDLDGNVIWYYADPALTAFVDPFRQLSSGHFIMSSPQTIREVDPEGNIIRQITIAELQSRLLARGFPPVAGSFHHEVLELPNGHLAALVHYSLNFDSPANYPGIQTVTVDAIVDLDTQLQPIWVWSGADHLDINENQPWGLPDWTHSNGLAYSPTDGSLVLSVRHLNELVKIDFGDGLGSGAIIWKLGVNRDFSLTNGSVADWFFGQHNPNLVVASTLNPVISVWDNGDFRLPDANCGVPGPSTCYSRAVVYSLDVSAHTATIAWEHSVGVYAPFIGSVAVLPGGSIEYDIGTFNAAPQARLQEVTMDSAADVLWQLDMTGAYIYRSTRIPSLYPGIQW